MFWLRFLIGGFIVAAVPWVATHVNNRVAGYLITIPVIFTLGIFFQYLAHGNKATVGLVQGSLIALPALVVFGLISLVSLRCGVGITLTLILSCLGWIVSLAVINMIAA